jgi:hypothetical protein
MAMIPVVHGKGCSIKQLRRQIALLETKQAKTKTEIALLEMLKTILTLRVPR